MTIRYYKPETLEVDFDVADLFDAPAEPVGTGQPLMPDVALADCFAGGRFGPTPLALLMPMPAVVPPVSDDVEQHLRRRLHLMAYGAGPVVDLSSLRVLEAPSPTERARAMGRRGRFDGDLRRRGSTRARRSRRWRRLRRAYFGGGR